MLRVGLVALIAAPMAAAATGASTVSHSGCVTTGVNLPVPLVARTARGTFALRRDGLRCRVAADPPALPEGAQGWPNTGVWIRGAHSRLVVGRWHRTIWRSSGKFARTYNVGPVVLGRHELAFSYGVSVSRLFIARLGGPEHGVALGEYPLGWTSGGGLYIARVHGGAILLRSPSGTERPTDGKARTAAYDGSTESLYFVAHGRLFRAHGSREQALASLATLDLPSSDRSLQVLLLGRLLALEDAHRLIVLRRDGSLVSSTPLPTGSRLSDSISGGPVASMRSGAVAFAALHPDKRVLTEIYERGVETVYLLRPGARAAVPVHSERIRFNVCGHGAELAWHSHWLLYSTGEGPAALIDTSSGRATDLFSVVRRLPGFTGVKESSPLSVTWG